MCVRADRFSTGSKYRNPQKDWLHLFPLFFFFLPTTAHYSDPPYSRLLYNLSKYNFPFDFHLLFLLDQWSCFYTLDRRSFDTGSCTCKYSAHSFLPVSTSFGKPLKDCQSILYFLRLFSIKKYTKLTKLFEVTMPIGAEESKWGKMKSLKTIHSKR